MVYNYYSKVGIWLMLTLYANYQTSVEAQVFSLSSCPSVNVVSNFNISAYAGKWYENRNYFAIFQVGLRCVTAEYEVNGNEVIVKNSGKRAITGASSVVTGKARQLEPPNGKLGVSFSSIPFTPTDAPYWVLDTDYTSYSVVWSCNTVGFFSSRIAWILTRDIVPSDTTINKALNVFSQNNIDQSPLRLTSQQNC